MSNAEEIRKYYRELLDDNMEHDRTELFDYARRKCTNRNGFTEGMLTGALKALVDTDHKYKSIRRGVYCRVQTEARYIDNYISEQMNILRETIGRLNGNQFDIFQGLDITERDKEKLQLIRICMREIQDTVTKIEALG